MEDEKLEQEQEQLEQPQEQEQPEQPEQKEEQANLSSLIDEVKQQYETKLTEMVAKKDREIAERDNVIKQLIDQEDKTAVFEKSIADKINEKRNYKKW